MENVMNKMVIGIILMCVTFVSHGEWTYHKIVDEFTDEIIHGAEVIDVNNNAILGVACIPDNIRNKTNTIIVLGTINFSFASYGRYRINNEEPKPIVIKLLPAHLTIQGIIDFTSSLDFQDFLSLFGISSHYIIVGISTEELRRANRLRIQYGRAVYDFAGDKRQNLIRALDLGGCL
jgi:hypothetical protein